MILVSAFLAGGLFGLGLCLSGMTNPDYVLQFLDVFGNWSPRLALVMAGAIATFAPLYRLNTRRSAPVTGGEFQFPPKREVNWRLLLGALVFGIGWGLSGFCPGPAIASLASFKWDVVIFVAAMLGGMFWAKGEASSRSLREFP